MLQWCLMGINLEPRSCQNYSYFGRLKELAETYYYITDPPKVVTKKWILQYFTSELKHTTFPGNKKSKREKTFKWLQKSLNVKSLYSTKPLYFRLTTTWTWIWVRLDGRLGWATDMTRPVTPAGDEPERTMACALTCSLSADDV